MGDADSVKRSGSDQVLGGDSPATDGGGLAAGKADPLTIASWGGGTNSTAMLLEWLRRGLRLDLVMFADTGGEKPHTYKHRDDFFSWLKEHGVTCITVRGNYKYDTLEEECLGSKTLPSLAYGFKKCSLKWKRAPQDIFANNWPPAQEVWKRGEKVRKLIGYDAGETRRAKIADDEKYDYCYPLIEWGVDRKGCEDIIRANGMELPGKSSCFFCPASKSGEILDLARDYPDLLKRALEIEENADLWTVKGLGRRYAWRDLLNQESRQARLWPEEDIPCDCMD